MLALDTTTLIIIVTVIISLMAWQNDKLLNRLIFYPPAVSQGQWYRFITHGFIHADSTHLLFNMITLYFFGQAVESFFNQYLGTAGFFIFYLLAIVVAMIPSYLKNRRNAVYRSLGASGGVSAVLFAFILMRPWDTILLFFIPMPAIVFAIGYIAYSIYANKKGNSNINHSAHLWGGAFGVIAIILIEPKIIPYFVNTLLHPSF